MSSLVTQWLDILTAAGLASRLFRDTAHSVSAIDHRKRVLDRFSPSTLVAYFAVWKHWNEFALIHGASPFHAPAVLLADFLQQCSKRPKSGSAVNACKALNWWAKSAGLDHLECALANPVVTAYSCSTMAVARRESMPLALSFVVWMEAAVLQRRFSPAMIILIGSFLLATWASLRWNDLLWSRPEDLHLEEQVLRGMAHRTKTTRRGMPFGIHILGFLGSSASSSWVVTWLHFVRQAVADTLAVNAGFAIDFLLPALVGSAERPHFHSPLNRQQGIKILRSLLSTFYEDHGQRMDCASASCLGVHSFKVTFLSWARQLNLNEEWRRHQGHHRADGAKGSVALYSRDDVWPALQLQQAVQSQIRAGFRPLQPMLRGGGASRVDFPVVLKPLSEGDVAPTPPLGLQFASMDATDFVDSFSSSSSETSDGGSTPSHASTCPRGGSAFIDSPARVGETFWLINVATSVAHVAKCCAEGDPLRVHFGEDDEQCYKFACGARLTMTDTTLTLATSLDDGVHRCLRHGCLRRQLVDFPDLALQDC